MEPVPSMPKSGMRTTGYYSATWAIGYAADDKAMRSMAYVFIFSEN
jgi:hypothetical protein